jgi:hypothetical protein
LEQTLVAGRIGRVGEIKVIVDAILLLGPANIAGETVLWGLRSPGTEVPEPEVNLQSPATSRASTSDPGRHKKHEALG